MRIIELRALRGPNYWSNYRKKLIYMLLDLESYETKPSNKIPGFSDRLKIVLPEMISHQCGYKNAGGFFRAVEEGTWAGHIIEHIALELQSMAGIEAGFGRTRQSNKPGVYHVLFNYEEESSGIYAAKAAVDVFLSLAEGSGQESLKEKISEYVYQIRKRNHEARLGPSTRSIVQEAEKRNIPYIRLDEESYVQLGYGIHQKRIIAAMTSQTSALAMELASDKYETKRVLADMSVPVPHAVIITTKEELSDAVEDVGFPLVIKPLDASQGKGVTVNVNSFEDALEAYQDAEKYAKKIIIERSLTGRDFRALVINYKFVAAAERIPPYVTGNGKNTILELVDMINADLRRGDSHDNILSKIKIDDHTNHLLRQKNYSANTVLPENETCYLKSVANLSTGGTAIDRTEEVHPENVFLLERIARIIGLDICGIDIVAPSLDTPLMSNGGGVIEVNAAPGLRMHLNPSFGQGRNVAGKIIDMLFPDNVQSRIPIISITGTNGKTTTTRLTAHLFKQTGKTVGYTTTDGIYVNDKLIIAGDTTGFISARTILKDPCVEVAVLESARGGIIRNGLAFDNCDVGVVLNIGADHLGISDMNTLEDMARVKEVVPRSVRTEGYAVLNADDTLVYNMRNEIDCNIALFSLDENNIRIMDHIEYGGMAALAKDNAVFIFEKGEQKFVEHLKNVPLTFNGKAAFMVQNVLASVLASYAQGLDLELIRKGLNSFIPSPELTPGRLNIIKMGHFDIIVDYAHNAESLRALGNLLKHYSGSRITGLFGGTGDRRDTDIKQFGKCAAKMFTRIIIKEDEAMLRGRQPGEMGELLLEGIRSVDDDIQVKLIRDELEALQTAIDESIDDEVIVLLYDNFEKSMKFIEELKTKKPIPQ